MTSQAARQLKTVLGENIAVAREAKGLKQRELAAVLAAATGRSIEGFAVSRWERGIVTPGATYLAALAEALGRDIAWFYVDHHSVAAADRIDAA